jgi:hypothetical protein
MTPPITAATRCEGSNPALRHVHPAVNRAAVDLPDPVTAEEYHSMSQAVPGTQG